MDFTIADRLVALRRAHGYSQESLSQELGLTRQAVSRWERGESLPDTENLIALADLYGVTLDELVRPQTGPEGAPVAEAPTEVVAKPAADEAEAPTEVVAAPVAETSPLEVEAPSELSEPDVSSEPAVAVEAGEMPIAVATESPATPAPDHLPAQPEPSQQLGDPSSTRVVPQVLQPPTTSTVQPQEQPRSRHRGCLLALAFLLIGLLLMGAILVSLQHLFGFIPTRTTAVESESPNGVASADESPNGVASADESPSGVASADESPNGVASAGASFNPDEVSSLRIDWAAGSVVIAVADDEEIGDEIYVREEYLDGELAEHPMETDVAQGELYVGYGHGGAGAWDMSFGSRGKRLTVLLPERVAKSLKQVRLELVANEFHMADLSCDELSIDLASGNAEVDDVTAKQLDLQVASGEIDIEGTFTKKMSIEVGSGSAEVTSDVVPQDTDISVASGDVDLELPQDASFTAEVTVTSGEFELDYAAQTKGNTYVVGTGKAAIDVTIASGEVSIEPIAR